MYCRWETSSPLLPAGIVGWCMCSAQVNAERILSSCRFVCWIQTGSRFCKRECRSVSRPAIAGDWCCVMAWFVLHRGLDVMSRSMQQLILCLGFACMGSHCGFLSWFTNGEKGHGLSVLSALHSFLEHLQRDARLQSRVQSAMTAAEVAMIAQELGYAVSGSELLLLSGKSLTGMRVVRIDHPGEYPHRYWVKLLSTNTDVSERWHAP